MTLFELIKSDAFNEEAMAEFLMTIFNSTINTVLSAFGINSGNQTLVKSEVKAVFLKMLKSDCEIYMKQTENDK